ncbi:MAG: hypothetical protein RR998_09655 [Oscillospiraceae bacterium]
MIYCCAIDESMTLNLSLRGAAISVSPWLPDIAQKKTDLSVQTLPSSEGRSKLKISQWAEERAYVQKSAVGVAKYEPGFVFTDSADTGESGRIKSRTSTTHTDKARILKFAYLSVILNSLSIRIIYFSEGSVGYRNNKSCQ